MTHLSDSQIAAIKTLVDSQAEDEGLWFLSCTASEAYLQQELRKLHAAIEHLSTPASLVTEDEVDALAIELAWCKHAGMTGHDTARKILSHFGPRLAGGWQPIASAPKDGTWILVCRPSYKMAHVARWRIDTWECPPTLGNMIYDSATLWAPLLQPPPTAEG